MSGVLTRSADAVQDTLRARAVALSRPPVVDDDSTSRLDLLEFTLAHERYAVESKCVREVYPLRDLTPIPCTPPFILGIVNIRGRLVSVIDLRQFFDLPVNSLTDLNEVIILESGGVELGILADTILEVRQVQERTIQVSLPTLTGSHAALLRGVTADRLVILDAGKILSDRRLVVHQEVEL